MEQTTDQNIVAGALSRFATINALFDRTTGVCKDRLMAKCLLADLSAYLDLHGGHSFVTSHTFDKVAFRLPKLRSRVDRMWISRLYNAEIGLLHDFDTSVERQRQFAWP